MKALWSTRKLSEIADIYGGNGFPRNLQGNASGRYPFAKVGDISHALTLHSSDIGTAKNYVGEAVARELRARVFPAGTIVMAKIGEAIRLNRRAITTCEMIIDNNAMGITPNTDIIEPYFLLFYMRTVDSYALASKTVVPSIKKSTLGDLDIPCPALSEQRRIVSRIKECMERIDEVRELRAEGLKEASALFPSTIHTRFAELADAYAIEQLGDVADIKGGGSLPKGITEDPGSEFPMLFKVADMNLPGNELIATQSRAYLETRENGKKVVPAGAIILPKRGGAIATNKKRLLGRPALIDPNLMGIVPKPDKLLSGYLLLWFENFDLMSITSGGIIPQLNKKDLAPLDIPVPPLDVQEAVVDELDAVRATTAEMVATFDTYTTDHEHIAGAVLRKAFAGEL